MEKSLGTSYYVKALIGICIMLLFKYLPAPAPITPFGMNVLGVFFGTIFLWCTTAVIWPSLLAVTVMGLSTGHGVNPFWGSSWGNSIVLFVFLLCAFAQLLSDSGLNDYISAWAISRKFTEGHPWRLIAVLLIGAMLSAAIIGALAAILIFWSVCYAIFDEVGYKKGDKLPSVVCYGICFMGGVGGCMVPFQVTAVSYYGMMIAGSGGALSGYSYSAYLIFGILIAALTVALYLILARYVIKPDISLLMNYKPKNSAKIKMNNRQKISAWIMLLLFVALLIPSMIPGNGKLVTFFNNLGNVGTVAIILTILGFIVYKGKPYMEIGSLLSKGVVWNLVFMLTAVFMFSGQMNNPDSGITPYVTHLITPLLGGIGKYGYIVMFMLITLVLTNIVNNMIVGAIFMPIQYAICMSLGINPIVMVALFIFVVDYAFFLPSSSPVGALIHASNDGWIPNDRIYKYGTLFLLCEALLVVIVGYPLGNLLF
jgi:Di- and tricarboxylate transporters